jgi:CRP-like cAMP-binding protein
MSVEQNRLLAALPPQEYAQLLPCLEPVHLQTNQLLAVPDEPIEYVYFLRDAVVSLLVVMKNGTAIESAMIGSEGLVGLQVFLGNDNATEEMAVQIHGRAARLHVAPFRQLVGHSHLFENLLHQYTLALMNQLARTAGCSLRHSVEQRCARWLLMCRDRLGRNTFPLTHESLGLILAARRASVSVAVEALQRAEVIRSIRGCVTILDPTRLEIAACEDYKLIGTAYDLMYA